MNNIIHPYSMMNGIPNHHMNLMNRTNNMTQINPFINNNNNNTNNANIATMNMNTNTNPIININITPNIKPVIEYKKLYIGRFPSSISDTFIIKLLETCGVINMWKRAKDHLGNNKGYGICEYVSVEGMLKCLRLLNGAQIEEGYEMNVSQSPIIICIYIIFNFTG